MKTVKRIRLSQISMQELKDKQMKKIKGGNYCRDKCGSTTPAIGYAYGEWVSYF